MNYTALVVAAGSGSRMGLGYNKLLYKLNNGNTILQETLAVFKRDPRCSEIVVVASSEDMAQFTSLCKGEHMVFVQGGETRQDSVYHGLQAVTNDYVLIHDGARPWLSMNCIDRLVDMLSHCRACLLMVPLKDTVKVVEDGIVKHTPQRSTLWQAQTPQAFSTEAIRSAYETAIKQNITATDDAQIMELCGNEQVVAVEGDYENIKVTTREDIAGR